MLKKFTKHKTIYSLIISFLFGIALTLITTSQIKEKENLYFLLFKDHASLVDFFRVNENKIIRYCTFTTYSEINDEMKKYKYIEDIVESSFGEKSFTLIIMNSDIYVIPLYGLPVKDLEFLGKECRSGAKR